MASWNGIPKNELPASATIHVFRVPGPITHQDTANISLPTERWSLNQSILCLTPDAAKSWKKTQSKRQSLGAVHFLKQVVLIVDKVPGEERQKSAHAYNIVLQTLLSVQMNNKLIIGDGSKKGGCRGKKEKESLLEQSRDTLHQSKKSRSRDKFMRCGDEPAIYRSV